jgi:quercetin dioxygenase-like cupin family protein
MVALPKGAALTTVVGAAQGADLPPGPKTVYRNSLPGLTLQGEFEMINLILEFAPGSATPLHSHGGPGIVTVIEGELVFAPEGKPEIVAKPGEVYLDLPGTHHTAVNKSAARAVVSYAVLLPKGGTLTTVTAATAQAPAPAPAPPEQPASAPTEFVGMPSTGEGDYNLVILVALVVAAGLIFEGMGRLLRTGGIRPRD